MKGNCKRKKKFNMQNEGDGAETTKMKRTLIFFVNYI